MSSKGGRPPVGPQVKISFPPDTLTTIDAIAKAYGVSRSEMVRRACNELIHMHQLKGKP